MPTSARAHAHALCPLRTPHVPRPAPTRPRARAPHARPWQTLANVWRKAAYRTLLEHHEQLGIRAAERSTLSPTRAAEGPARHPAGRAAATRLRERLVQCIDVFREKVALEVTDKVPERHDGERHSRDADTLLGGGTARLYSRQPEGTFITRPEQRDVCEAVFARLREAQGGGGGGGRGQVGAAAARLRNYSAEQEQEQEQEQEEELQMETLQHDEEEPEEVSHRPAPTPPRWQRRRPVMASRAPRGRARP